MSPDTFPSWQVWALLSAVFAALTAIFAKVGVEDINSDLATLIRTVVVLISLSRDPVCDRPVQPVGPDLDQELGVPVSVRDGHRRVMALLFSRAQTGPATLVAPV